jgi:hypothetical protein
MKRPILATVLALSAWAATDNPAHAWKKCQFSCGLSFCRESSGGFYYNSMHSFGCNPGPMPCCAGGGPCCGYGGPSMFDALHAYGPAGFGYPGAPYAGYGHVGSGASPPLAYGGPAASPAPAPAPVPAPPFVAPQPTPAQPAPMPPVKPTAQQVGYTAPSSYGYSGYGYGYGNGYGSADAGGYNQAPSYWYGD